MNTRKLKKLALTLVILFSGLTVSAQCDPMFDPFCEDVDVPLDDHIILLICAAAAIGFWFIAKNKFPQTVK